MGWIGVYEKPADRKEYVLRSWNFENESVKSEVLAASMVGGVVYAAVKHTSKIGKKQSMYEMVDNAIVFGVVILTKMYKGEFMWKDMDEGCGPNETDCPAKIIKLLSPIVGTDSSAEWARKWREACLAPKPKAAKLAIGTKIKFKRPLLFRGVPADTFTKTTLNRRGRALNVFWNDRVGYCRIRLQNYNLGEHYEVA